MTTLFALASAPGRAGVAVFRVSGPRARDAVLGLTGKPPPPPRRAALRDFHDASGALIDEGLLLWFAAPASFTGEDVAELHVHGGAAVAAALTEALLALGLTPAGPGDFTRRAVENNRLDLTRAEAIADLVDAETDAQRRQALRQKSGALDTLYEGWRARLMRILAHAEAELDFADEELPDALIARARLQAIEIFNEIDAHLRLRHGERLRDGLTLTLIGPPNAGKSSFLNALARRDIAIVTPVAGTTRDVIEARLDLGGYPVTVADTAGLRETIDAIESEGVRRALERAESSDLVLLLLDGSSATPLDGLPPHPAPALTVWNKADLSWPAARAGLPLSLKTGAGMDAVIAALTGLAREAMDAPGETPALTRPRHRAALMEAAQALSRAQAAPSPELFAEDLRLAMRAIGRITGRVDVEDLLDIVFRDFCIGK